MRLGLPEIGIIIVVLIVIALSAGIRRGGAAGKASSSPGRVNERAGKARHVKLAGVVLVLVGLVLLSAAASLVKWIIWSYLWASVLIAIGLLLFLLARRR
jgi:hypothetical protein